MTKTSEGKVVLITCSCRSLGSAIADASADRGADVAISYARSADQAASIIERLKVKSVRAVATKSDQFALFTAKPLIEKMTSECGKLDNLVNNAGIMAPGLKVNDPELDSDEDNHKRQLNVLGSIANTRAAAPKLIDGGRIIFIGSVLGSYMSFPAIADYGATKWALAGRAKGILGPSQYNGVRRAARHHAHKYERRHRIQAARPGSHHGHAAGPPDCEAGRGRGHRLLPRGTRRELDHGRADQDCRRPWDLISARLAPKLIAGSSSSQAHNL